MRAPALLALALLGCSKDQTAEPRRQVTYTAQPTPDDPAAVTTTTKAAPKTTTEGTTKDDAGVDASVAPVDAGPPRAFGVACTQDGECAAGMCLASGICSGTCTADCSATTLPCPEWSCTPFAGVGQRWTCVPTGPELCDGRDNDCNGLVDDHCTP